MDIASPASVTTEAWLHSMRPKVRKAVSPSRYKHIEGVISWVLDLARRHGISELKAVQAGLLHDCAKNLPPAVLKRKLSAAGADKWEVQVPAIWHAPVGALLARTVYGVHDRDVLAAIRWHPCGRPGMSPLQRCLFVADFTEPGRKLKGQNRLRKLARKNLDMAFKEVMRAKMGYLLKTGKTLHPEGVQAWNELVIKK